MHGGDGAELKTGERASLFTNTHWSRVLLAAAPAETTRAAEALEYLCRTYWYPLYAYVRRCGNGPDEAQDLTQEFFSQMLKRNDFARANPSKGRFRSFLLAAMNHFLCSEWRKAKTIKRGGEYTFLSLDGQAAEERYRYEPVSELTPETVYERQWALTLFHRALGRLEEGWVGAGKQVQFVAFRPFLFCPAVEVNYEEVAAKLGISKGAVAAAVFRLRKRCSELIRDEIAHTVTTVAELEEDLRYLFSLFQS
jgi:RNA polymerase sigma factor (sigma-70 family)